MKNSTNFIVRYSLIFLKKCFNVKQLKKLSAFWKKVGPGLVTGSSDDDPSGIATYSQAGASFGLSTLWTILLSFPLMASIQEMCARIGLVTSKGLTGTLKTYYPGWILYIMLLFSCPAIVLNIGADIAGMGAVGNLMFPAIDASYFSVVFTIILLISIIYFPYLKIASILKYLCIVLLVYFVVPFLFKQNWILIFSSTLIPSIHLDKDFLEIIVGILGTTISPYLFFWQATMEVEEMKHMKKHTMVDKKLIHDMKQDVDFGMGFSGLVAWFIILTTGTVLFNAGIHKIDTVEDAARALRPVAGNFSYFLFSIGILGTGFIAIPVLSGSLSYIFCETFGWKEGLDNKFHEARPFYIIIAVSLLIGLSLNYIGISPIKALLYAAMLYGVTAPVLIVIILHICNNKKVMGNYTNGLKSNLMGWITFAIMTLAAIALMFMEFIY